MPCKVGKSHLGAKADGVQHYEHDEPDEVGHPVHHFHFAHVEVFDPFVFLVRAYLVGIFVWNLKLVRSNLDLQLRLGVARTLVSALNALVTLGLPQQRALLHMRLILELVFDSAQADCCDSATD